MKYRIVTNNPMSSALPLDEQCEMVYMNESVKGILEHCSELLLLGKWTFLTDFMGGRRARPFPYLTVILKESADTLVETNERDWRQITSYQMLDSERCSLYADFGETLMEDFRVLDCSLTKTVLKKI